ncbi:MAG: sulfite exporter TauE/SafE family protein [Humidesulfovibrio sp.]|nr:sulfite exporter TauE/SafE family protein [Humidesulfovibrio sp.]
MFSPDLLHAFGFLMLGFVTGAYGTLIGAGGGFVLMPVLLLLYPHDSPALLTSISLAVVFVNAASGTEAYAVMRRVDYKTGVVFALASVPGAVLGALVTSFFPRNLFDILFGVTLLAGAIFLFIRKAVPCIVSAEAINGLTTRRIVDRFGDVYEYSFSMWKGVVLSVFVGFLSSFLGIGGGIIHVPAMVYLLGFPVHVATATSHFVLAVMAMAGTTMHIITGEFVHGVHRTIYLALGVIVGAQVGAHLSNRIRGPFIIRSLALALGFVGLRILYTGIMG